MDRTTTASTQRPQLVSQPLLALVRVPMVLELSLTGGSEGSRNASTRKSSHTDYSTGPASLTPGPSSNGRTSAVAGDDRRAYHGQHESCIGSPHAPQVPRRVHRPGLRAGTHDDKTDTTFGAGNGPESKEQTSGAGNGPASDSSATGAPSTTTSTTHGKTPRKALSDIGRTVRSGMSTTDEIFNYLKYHENYKDFLNHKGHHPHQVPLRVMGG